MSLQDLYKICDDLNSKFGQATPFQIITRLTEEVGELAQQVNHHENQGIKTKKYGSPSNENLVKEIRDVLVGTLQIAQYYNLEDNLKEHIKKRTFN